LRTFLPKRHKNRGLKPVIIIDTREQKPWKFSDFKTKTNKLEVGDYSFEGFEDVFVIERKASINELLTDVSGRNRKWFKQVLQRLSEVRTAIIVVEDSADNIADALRHIGKSEMTKQTLYWLLCQIVMKYRIPILFVGKNFRSKTSDVESFFYHVYQELKDL